MIPQYNGNSEQFFTDCSEYLSLVAQLNAPDSQIVCVLQQIIAMRDENAVELNSEILQSVSHNEPEEPKVVEYPNTFLGRACVAVIRGESLLLRFRDKIASFVASE